MKVKIKYIGQLDKTTLSVRKELKLLTLSNTSPMMDMLLRHESKNLFNYDDYLWLDFSWIKNKQLRCEEQDKQERDNYHEYINTLNLSHHVCIATINKKIVGWSIQDRTGQFNVYVQSNYRKSGIGTLLAQCYLLHVDKFNLRFHQHAKSVVERAAQTLSINIKYNK